MTIAGADFLTKLATIAVAFVGWSAIAVTFRRALGFELDALHMYFIRFFIEGGLAVAAFGLIPSSLALLGLEEATIWRLSSAGAALTFSGWFACLLRRRRRVTKGPIPKRTIVHFAAGITAALTLWVNAAGYPAPSPGAYSLALVALLVVGGCVFAQNLELFFSQATESAPGPEAVAHAAIGRGERLTLIQGGLTSAATSGLTATAGKPATRPAETAAAATAVIARPGCDWRTGHTSATGHAC